MGAEIPPLLADPDYCVVSRRHDAVGSRGRWLLFASLVAVSFGFALVFAAFGAWMVLPYSALEMTVLFFAFRWFERHAQDWERLAICADRVIVERECAGVRTRAELNRYWTRVELEDATLDGSVRLALRVGGRRIPFGDELPAPERLIVAADLRRLLAH